MEEKNYINQLIYPIRELLNKRRKVTKHKLENLQIKHEPNKHNRFLHFFHFGPQLSNFPFFS
jgi:hypothetical protein